MKEMSLGGVLEKQSKRDRSGLTVPWKSGHSVNLVLSLKNLNLRQKNSLQ